MYEICEGTEADWDSVLRLLWKAFKATTDLEVLRKNPLTKLWANEKQDQWAYIAKYNGKPVANLSFFTTTNDMIRERPLPIAGVWGVATFPEHRRRGLVKKIFQKAFPGMREKGAVLSVLDPFLVEFYEKFGYALAETRIRHEFRYQDIKSFSTDGEITSREIDDPMEFATLTKIQKSMARFGSRIFHFRRDYDSMIKSGNFHVLERKSKPVGMVKFDFNRLSASEDNEDLVLRVSSAAFVSDDVFPAIMELVANYSINIHHVTWWCDVQLPVQNYLRDVWAPKSFLGGSMMMRVIDFEGYCRSLRVPKDASESVVVKIVDDYCPWNESTYQLTPADGNLNIEITTKRPDVTLSPLALSKIVSGRIEVSLLRSLGEIQCSAKTADRLGRIFPLDNFMSYRRF